MYFNFPQLSSSFLLILHSEGLAVGMEDIDVGNEGDANGDVDDKDDAELCYTKHTGNQQHELLCCLLETRRKKRQILWEVGKLQISIGIKCIKM